MSRRLRSGALVPAGLVVERVGNAGGVTEIAVRSPQQHSRCPACGIKTAAVHSHYSRRLGDLPLGGRPVRLVLNARRFRCRTVCCAKRIFAERFDSDVVAPWARRTNRLGLLIFHLGLALGGRPGARFANRLMAPVSKDTLLRSIRRGGRPDHAAPTVVGIDDWAWRRNQRYGTIICDLERRRPIRLLPDREPATARGWLAGQQQIQVVARDRGGGYALAAAQALPHANQVADRWHLMENASRAFLDAVRYSMREIRRAVGTTSVNPGLLTAVERLQYEGYLRRQEDNEIILKQAQSGLAIKEIVRRTGRSRGYVRAVLRGQRTDIFRTRESSLEAWLPWLDAQWTGGQRNGTELWRQMRQQGFGGSLRVVTEWATRKRRAEKAEGLHRVPSARTIARLMTAERDALSRAETITVAAIEESIPQLVEARDITDAFHVMLRKKAVFSLETWLERARQSLINSFACGVLKDIDAVRAAIASNWSNGQTEGQITKLKLVKRQMYGRAKLDLLEARLIASAT
ncbi:ISL3 family transposase [Sphingomonas sp. TX0543]|uniref:ISL3 family transposase n=1 Tax=Sphingomonas TaxID=13687 RepID=UPI0022387EB3|nr:ISL3 family transposase [Sphingomonas lycopersici]MCW6531979.1 ISL3 family transposase [Sphingomonas lycopersici]